MKLIAFTAAGLLAASALTPVPAEAQRRGWHDEPRRGRSRHDRDDGPDDGWNGPVPDFLQVTLTR